MPLKSEKYFTILELALLLYKKGDFNESLGLIQEAKELNQVDGALCHVGALSAFRMGNISGADSFIKQAIDLEPHEPAHWNVQGEILRLSGDLFGAIRALQQALALDPSAADVYSNLGNVYSDAQDFENASAAYRKALAIDPNHIDALFNLGNIAFKSQKFSIALESYQKALAVAPNHLGALNNYGILLTNLREFDEAQAVYTKLLALKPDFIDGIVSYAQLLCDRYNLAQAEELIERSLPLIPKEHTLQLQLRLGAIRKDRGKRTEAMNAYRAALALDALNQEAVNGVINMDIELGNFLSANSRLSSECSRRPDDITLRYAQCFLTLPPMYRDEKDIVTARETYERLLTDLEELLAHTPESSLRDLPGILGSAQPFYLPYQGMNDRDLQDRYGKMISSTLSKVVKVPPLTPAPPLSGRKMRVGFVSGFFRGHSNYKIPVRGWIKNLDRSLFEIFGYHTQGRVDAHTREAETLCTRFYQGPKSLAEWVTIIQNDHLDAIIYPEIGMDPMCCRLACLRLAPHQAASWGHPTTSGIPTVDHFLSSELMEPENGQDCYTEKLVKLPNLSFSYEPPDRTVPALQRRDVGIREDAFVYWCCQTNYKYLPQYDWVFPAIAQQVPQAQFLFIQIQPESEASQLFRDRLKNAFAAKKLNVSDFVTYLPALDPEPFSAIAALCDIALDSFEWSGCNSSLETLAQGTPIVTCPGKFMRSRHTAAILTAIECPETITKSPQEFVDRAVEYAKNREALAALRGRVKSLISRAYNDHAAVKGLQDTLTAWIS
jgi:predicted O-linked N-acetylglucosamine transferase (SPINDLY family)